MLMYRTKGGMHMYSTTGVRYGTCLWWVAASHGPIVLQGFCGAGVGRTSQTHRRLQTRRLVVLSSNPQRILVEHGLEL